MNLHPTPWGQIFIAQILRLDYRFPRRTEISIEGTEHADRGGPSMIMFAPNGPYVVRGGADLEGTELPRGGTLDHFTLCRCGASKNKPFCSGAHWDVKFDEDAGAKDDGS